MDILLYMEKDGQQLVVRYDPIRYHHDVFENGQHLGRVRLREFYFNGWKCVKREVLNVRL